MPTPKRWAQERNGAKRRVKSIAGLIQTLRGNRVLTTTEEVNLTTIHLNIQNLLDDWNSNNELSRYRVTGTIKEAKDANPR